MTKRHSARESSNQSFYDSDSEIYDARRWKSKGGAFSNEAQQGILERLCGDWHDSHVIEVGSGTARFTIPLLRKNNRMTLADVSSGMLAIAKKNIEVAGMEGLIQEYLQCSIYELPFDDGSFKHAISLNVFNHLERPGDALKQLSRVIQPGSTLLFNYANLYSYYWLVARRINKRKKAIGSDVFSSWEHPGKMQKIITEAGLELVCMIGHVHVPATIERYPVHSVLRLLDTVSRQGAMVRFAPFHFCLCRKPR